MFCRDHRDGIAAANRAEYEATVLCIGLGGAIGLCAATIAIAAIARLLG